MPRTTAAHAATMGAPAAADAVAVAFSARRDWKTAAQLGRVLRIAPNSPLASLSQRGCVGSGHADCTGDREHRLQVRMAAAQGHLDGAVAKPETWRLRAR